MKSILILAASLVLPAGLLQAQTPKLLKDINTTRWPTPSNPRPATSRGWAPTSGFAQIGNLLIFTATTDSTGYELFASDGTTKGTRLLKNIRPGSLSSMPREIQISGNGKLAYFCADDGTHDLELYVTDGTPAGTRLIKDLFSTGWQPGPSELAALGPTSVVFSANESKLGSELYVSDGTAAGTKLLKDMQVGTKSSYPMHLCATKDHKKVFFAATTQGKGEELWVTDGTSTGTRLVKDIFPGSGSSVPRYPVALGSSQILFQANDGKRGAELWVSDGTAAGTSLVIDLAKGTATGATTNRAFALGNKVIFRGYSSARGWEVHVTDGTAQGTQLLMDVWPGSKSSAIDWPHVDTRGTKAYWISQIASGDYRIIVSDGTPVGTKVFTPKNIHSQARELVEIRGRLYFRSKDLTPSTGIELCVSDGTMAGTKTIRDAYPGREDSSPKHLTRYRTIELIYAADAPEEGMEPWRMDPSGKFRLIDVNHHKHPSTYSSDPEAVARFGNRVFFSANDGKNGKETWITDGTNAGTRLLKDLFPGKGSSGPRFYAVAGDKLVFDAFTPATGTELFVTDGTAAGTKLLKDIRPGSSSSTPTELSTIGDKVYFSANNGTSGVEPWITDGTPAGTKMIKDLYPLATSSYPAGFAGHGKQVVFTSGGLMSGKNYGQELYITDGTAAGTRLLKDIYPGIRSSNPSFLTYSAGKVYFSAWSPTAGVELWVTDFTTAGTKLIKDLRPGLGHSAPSVLSARNGKIYFVANAPSTGTEIFVSDGTPLGTKVFLEFVPGPKGSLPWAISAIGSRKIYFQNQGRVSRNEAFVSDGTKAGTHPLKISPPNSARFEFFPTFPNLRLAMGSQVYLRGLHAIPGLEVFTIDNGATAEPIGTPFGSTWIQGSDPVIGKTATITGGTSLANAMHLTLFGLLAARPMRLGTAGFTHFDMAKYFGVTSVGTGKSFKHSLPIPSNPALKGVQIVFQTLSFDTNNLAGTLELSNGLHWAVGQ